MYQVLTAGVDDYAGGPTILCIFDIPVSFLWVDPLTIGCRLLLPHIPALLQYLGGVVRNSERLKKKKFRVQVSKELNILSKYVHISLFICKGSLKSHSH